MTSPRKAITVFGATGNQGGAVARSLAKNPAFEVRGITRYSSSPRAKSLVEAGVKAVQADGWDKDQLVEAFKGSWGAFINTNTEDPSCIQPDGPTESDLGKQIVDAAAEAGVNHVIYSSLADCEALTGGTVQCRMMLHKATIWKHILTRKSDFTTVTSVDAGWFFEGLLVEELADAFGGFPFHCDEEGYLSFRVPRWGPDNSWIGVVDDYGDIVHGVFLDPQKYDSKTVQGISEVIDFEGIVDAWNKVFPEKKARFVPLASWEEFATYGDRQLEDLKELFHFSDVVGKLPQGESSDGEGWEVETRTAAELKQSARKAMGEVEDGGELMTAERFIRKYF